MKRKYKELSKNTALFAISSLGTKFLSFLLVPLYTNVLTTGEYGVADILSTTTTLLIVILTINISDGILIFFMDKASNPKEILAFGLKVMFLGWGLLILGSSIMVSFRFTSWPITYYIFIILFFIISVLNTIFSNYLRAIERVKVVAIGAIISSVVFICGNILFLLIIKIGLYGYLISTVLGPFAGFLYYFAVSQVPLKVLINGTCDKSSRKVILKYCFPLIFNSLALWINSCLDRYFVTGICGVEQNGIYSIANKIPVILSTVYTVFSQAWTLSAVKEFDREDKDGFFSNTYSAYNAWMCMVCSGLILMNIPFAKVLYGKGFFVAWNYSSVLLLAILFNSLTAFIGSIFSATKQSNILAITTIISAIVNTILNAVLIPIWGVMGAAIATGVALMTMWAIRLIFVRKTIDLRVNWISNIFVYLLLCLQVVVEHSKSHGYIYQVIIILTIAFVFRKQIKTGMVALSKIKKTIHNKKAPVM